MSHEITDSDLLEEVRRNNHFGQQRRIAVLVLSYSSLRPCDTVYQIEQKDRQDFLNKLARIQPLVKSDDK